jgi:hypothetical protein
MARQTIEAAGPTVFPAFVAVVLAVALIAAPSIAAKRTGQRQHPPRSGVVTVRGPARSAVTATSAAGPASFSTVPVSVGANRNVIVGDVTNTSEHSSGPACHVGDQTPQNETTISMDPTDSDNLIGGANDYRYFLPSEGRYDGSAHAYVSHNGGATWTNVPMPGLSEAFGGTYQGIGDPAFAWDPGGSAVYYANIAFNRVANPATGHSAFASSVGGETWSAPQVISGPYAQFSTPVVHDDGTADGVIYVSYEEWNNPVGRNGGRAMVARSEDGGQTWTRHFVGRVNDLPSPLPHGAFRVASYPVLDLAEDGTLHVVWSNWQAGSADIVYTRSDDGAESWSRPVTINQEATKSDQFFQWIDASGDHVHVGFVDRQYSDDALLDHSYVVSTDGGDTWSQTVRVTTNSSRSDASLFGANCTGEFIGDYTGIVADGDTAHLLWMDGRPGTQPTSASGDDDDQDAFHAEVTVG